MQKNKLLQQLDKLLESLNDAYDEMLFESKQIQELLRSELDRQLYLDYLYYLTDSDSSFETSDTGLDELLQLLKVARLGAQRSIIVSRFPDDLFHIADSDYRIVNEEYNKSTLEEDEYRLPAGAFRQQFKLSHILPTQMHIRLLQIHTLKDYPEFKDNRLQTALKKVDPNKLREYFFKFYQHFQKAVSKPCININELDATPIRQAYQYLLSSLGQEDYIYIVEKFSENYGFYRKPETTVYIVSLITALYYKDVYLVEYVLVTYGLFVFTRMFIQFFKYCNPELLTAAIERQRSNSLFAKYGSNYIAIVGHIVSTKFNTLLSKDTLTAHNVSLLFSTIKVRTKDVLQNLAKQYYKLVKEGYHTRGDIAMEKSSTTSSTELVQFIELTAHYIRNMSGINAEVLNKIAGMLKISPATASLFMEKVIEYLQSLSDDQLQKILQLMFTSAGGLIQKQDICDYNLLRKFDKILQTKTGKQSSMLKQAIDAIIAGTIEMFKDELPAAAEQISKYTSVRAKFRRLVLYYIYIEAIRPAICSV